MGTRNFRIAGFIVLTTLLGVAGAATAEGLNAAPANKAQRAMLKVIEHWQDTYNNDVEKMITDCYAPEADVFFNGGSAKGYDQFKKLENAIRGAAPGRYMRIDRVLFAGNEMAIVEAVIKDKARPDYFSPWMAILAFRHGRIIHDRTYLDPAQWPGLEAVKGIPTPGGLGVVAPPLKY